MTTSRGRRAVAVICALGVAVVAAFSLGEITGTSGWPSIMAPMPATLAIPAFFAADSPLGWLVLALPAVVFLLWVLPARDWSSAIPKRSVVLARVISVLSAAWFVFGWRWAIRYQGWTYTIVTAALSLAAVVWLEQLRMRAGGGSHLSEVATVPLRIVHLVFHVRVPMVGGNPFERQVLASAVPRGHGNRNGGNSLPRARPSRYPC